jgi:hypothetical protein
VDAVLGKTQARSALPPGGDRAMGGLEAIFAEDAIVAHALDLEEPMIGRKSDFAHLEQIGQTFADPKVIGCCCSSSRCAKPCFPCDTA